MSANTSRETASRALAALIRRGIVSRNDSELVIAAPRMLQELIC
ncbi:MAG: helix-turn-helix domain-containing protein [Rhizorhabdus sp.]